jgi:hypothetical protein
MMSAKKLMSPKLEQSPHQRYARETKKITAKEEDVPSYHHQKSSQAIEIKLKISFKISTCAGA